MKLEAIERHKDSIKPGEALRLGGPGLAGEMEQLVLTSSASNRPLCHDG